LNKIIKNLYSTDFFESITISISQNNLILTVIENPIIQTININGIKNKNILKILDENLTLKEKSSFVQNNVKKDETKLKNILKSNGYYFSKVVTKIKKNDNNSIDLNYYIDLGEKAFIENIKFIGDKIIKDSKLKKVIISEEAKFWKFISSRKFLDKKRIQIDENLLKNYYKNNGYYNVKVNSTFAQIVNNNNFELIFNINAGKKYYFKNTNLEIPQSFDKKYFIEINETLKKVRG
jgi:Outer membrane protein/protective antigen OMA87